MGVKGGSGWKERHKAQGISFMVLLRDEILLHTSILSPPARAQVRGDDGGIWDLGFAEG